MEDVGFALDCEGWMGFGEGVRRNQGSQVGAAMGKGWDWERVHGDYVTAGRLK